MVTVLLMLLAIGFAAAAFGKRFRLYSLATLVVLVAFGALTGVEAPRIAENLPTPWIGVWERINIGVFLLWVMALAITLLRVRETSSAAGFRRAEKNAAGRRTSTDVAIHAFARTGIETVQASRPLGVEVPTAFRRPRGPRS